MKTLLLHYEGSVTPKATSFLKSEPIDMSFSATYEVEESDAAHAKTIQKEFQSAMASAIKSQAKFLDKWLEEKDALISDMVKRYNKLKGGFPSNPSDGAKFVQETAEMAEIAKKLDEYPNDFREIVSNWAEGCREQQGLIAMQTALKSARVKTFSEKNFRVKAGLVVKAVLVIAVIALSIAAIVLSAGAMTPVVLGLAATGLALSGISSLGGLAKTIATNVNTEKKLLSNLKGDVEDIQQAMTGMRDKGTKLTKHVTELQNLIKIKEDQLQQIEADAKKYIVQARSYEVELGKLTVLVANGMLDEKAFKAKQKASKEVSAKLAELTTTFAKTRHDLAKSKLLLNNLTALGVDLDKVSGHAPNSVLSNIKDKATSVDGWLEMTGTVGGLVGASAYVIV